MRAHLPKRTEDDKKEDSAQNHVPKRPLNFWTSCIREPFRLKPGSGGCDWWKPFAVPTVKHRIDPGVF